MNKEKNKNAEINKMKENLSIKLLQVKQLIVDQRSNKLILDFDNNSDKKQISLMGTISLDEVNMLINALTHLRNDFLI